MIISFDKLSGLRKKYRNKKIVFCSGSFDLPHAGHVLFFEECKKLGDVLVVMVGRDDEMKIQKGPNRPIMNQDVRLKVVDSFKSVDFCFINPPTPDTENLFDKVVPIFENLHPDIYAVNEDAYDIPYRRKVAKKYGTKLIVLSRSCPKKFENISTTKIIEKIKRELSPENFKK